jgi:hypothetical protein
VKKDKTDITLTQEDFGILVTCATRYAIGRQSYMPYLVTGIVKPLLDRLDDKTLGCLIRDIEGTHSLGDPLIDEPMWRLLLEQAKQEKARRNADVWSPVD